MQKAFYIITILYLSFLSGGCQETPYSTIIVTTGWGSEQIPGFCSAWTDGCDIYCREGSRDWYKVKLKTLCKNEDLHASQCIDSEPEQLKLCNDDPDNREN